MLLWRLERKSRLFRTTVLPLLADENPILSFVPGDPPSDPRHQTYSAQREDGYVHRSEWLDISQNPGTFSVWK
jgi:hypothetical protein